MTPRTTPSRPPASAPILIVEDDPGHRRMLQWMLAEYGLPIACASDGWQALALALREQPALVILDLLMPRVDGFAVVEALRAEPSTAEIPIIVLTARAMPPEDKARLNGRISHLAEKGAFDRAAFLDLVRRLAAAPTA